MSSSAVTRVLSRLSMLSAASVSSALVPRGNSSMIAFRSSASSSMLPCLATRTNTQDHTAVISHHLLLTKLACKTKHKLITGQSTGDLHRVVDRLASPLVAPVGQREPGFGQLGTLHSAVVKQSTNHSVAFRQHGTVHPITWSKTNISQSIISQENAYEYHR